MEIWALQIFSLKLFPDKEENQEETQPFNQM